MYAIRSYYVDDPDPECDLDFARDGAVTREVDVVMTNSFGFGGHNVSLLVGRFAA